MNLRSRLPSWHCKGKSVFLRADLNVPLNNGVIVNDERLRATQPTIDHLIAQQAIIILATHLGRPTDHEASLSTRILLTWFEKRNYAITWCATIDEAARQRRASAQGTIILLENLRFFKAEQHPTVAFAKQLASLASFYVNDAFGALHRNDASIALLPYQFSSDHRTIGFLVEKELATLNTVLEHPPRPLSIILGGNKIGSKVPLIKNLINIADHIMLCPAIVFTFLKAQGKSVGASLVNDTILADIKALIQAAADTQCALHMPHDYQVADGRIDDPLSIVDAASFPPQAIGISIGPRTTALFAKIIRQSNGTLFNGAIGFIDRPDTLQGMKALFTAMAAGPGTSWVMGGDSLAALQYLQIQGITHQITGGGAALAYLSGEKLPGLEPFDR